MTLRDGFISEVSFIESSGVSGGVSDVLSPQSAISGPVGGICATCGQIHAAALPGGEPPPIGLDTPTSTDIVAVITRDSRSYVADGTRGKAALVTYSFLDAIPSGSTATEYPGFASFTEDQRVHMRAAFAVWAAASGLSFLEVPASVGGSIQIGLHNFVGTSFADSSGYASYPTSSPNQSIRQVLMMRREDYATAASIAPGTYGFQTLLHEIGHNIGLSHTFDVSPKLSTELDNTTYTLMSYTNTVQDRVTAGAGDLLAVTSLYGTDAQESADGVTYTVNTSNWTVVFTGGATDDVITGTNLSDTITGGTGADRLHGGAGNDLILADGSDITLGGGEGTDTLDFSNSTVGVVVDLSSTTSSTYSGTAVAGSNTIQTASFENLTGSSLADTLTGSAFDAGTISGGAGNDRLIAARSTHTLVGGAGDDVYVLTGFSTVTVTESADAGADTIIVNTSTYTLPDNVENLQGSSTAFTANFTGNASDNTLTGGQFGDSLTGGAGNDTLISNGGIDRMISGSGTDTVVVNFTAATQRVARFGSLVAVVSSGSGVVADGDTETIRYSDNSTATLSTLSQDSGSIAYNWMTTSGGTTGRLYDDVNFSGTTNRATTLSFTGSSGVSQYLLLDNGGTRVNISGFDSLSGGTGADRATLSGSTNTIAIGAVETIIGSTGDDSVTLLDTLAVQTISGAAGYDNVILSGKRSDYTMTRSGTQTTVSDSSNTFILSDVERLTFSDRSELASIPDWTTALTSLSLQNTGAAAVTVQQQTITPVVDATRGTLGSKVTVNGSDISGVPATLKQGWRVGTVSDIDGDGKKEIFFFGLDQVAGVGSGFGATWELNSSGAVETPQLQFQMRIAGWDVVGAANVNSKTGDEIIWQNTLTGAKAIWSDTNQDGTVDLGIVVSGLPTSTAQRIVGTADVDGNGIRDLLMFNDQTSAMTVYFLTDNGTGTVSSATNESFASYAAFATAMTTRGVTPSLFSILTPI
jgi:hypothetical protein